MCHTSSVENRNRSSIMTLSMAIYTKCVYVGVVVFRLSIIIFYSLLY